MSKKDNQNVIIEPNVFAAMNPGYGVVGNNVVSGSTISGPVVATPMGNAVVTPAGNVPVNTPTEQLRQDNAGLVDNSPTDDVQGVQPKKTGSKLGDFFRGLAGKVKPWGGTDASKSDGGTIGYLGSLYTSPAEEAEYRRRSQNKMKLLALADAVRQFGNIYHTTQYAPSQHFENIYDKERARYLQDKAVRDRDNQYYFQQKAREAQMDMQRERMAAEAAARAERLAWVRELQPFKVREHEGRAKAAEANAGIKALEYDYKPTEIEKKSKKADEETNLLIARKNKTYSDAANNTRRTNALNAKTYSSMNNGGGSGGGGGYSGSGSWTSRRDGSSWRGTPQKGDIKIQEYRNKDQWVISEKDWKNNYARINEILEQNPNSAAAKALKNAKNETERMAIAQRYATSTKESYNYMRALSKGHIPGNKAYASTESKQTGNRTVNMNAQRQAAVNKLQGKSV